MYLNESSTVLFWRPETYPKNCHYQKSVDEIPWYCMVWFPFTQKPLSQNVSKDLVYFVAVSRSELVKYLTNKEALGAFHLVKISGISGYVVNGTRFVGSSHWKIPRKVENLKKVGPFSRLEFPKGMSCSIYLSRSLYQFQVHGRAWRRTGVCDQMEQRFTNRKFHFCSHRNFRVFFLNGKRPFSVLCSVVKRAGGGYKEHEVL